MSETPHATLVHTAAEMQPSGELHAAIVDQYMHNRKTTGARIESRFLDSLLTTDTPYFEDGYATSVAVTTASSRRRLLRTARELNVFDDYGFAALRAGVYACANGEVAIAQSASLSTAEARYTPSTKDAGKLEAVAMPGDSIVTELQQMLVHAPSEAMSSSAITYSEAPELFAAIIDRSLGDAIRYDGFQSIHTAAATEALYKALPVFMPGDPESATKSTAGIYYDHDNHVTKYVLPIAENTGYAFVFEPASTAQTSLREGAYRIGVERNDETYNTQPDYSNQFEATPFTLTEDAGAFCSALESVGLVPSEQLTDILAGNVKRRYGDSIAHATALLSSVVNNPDGTAQDLFLNQNASELVANLQQADATTALPVGARLLIDTIEAINSRTQETALPVSPKAKSSELYGICKDVESYYADAFGTSGLQDVVIDGVPMLEKTHGQHTFMLREQTMFNGVAMPAGTVMIQLNDGWAAGRISAFAVTEYSSNPIADARRIFGAQLEEMLQQGGNEEYTSAKFAQVCSNLS